MTDIVTAPAALQSLLDIMARLRDPINGCPWDIKQDFTSIAPYTIEEAYEVVDAIQRNDMANLREELGDLLLQVIYHSQMAGEVGHFTFQDVAQDLAKKLIRRHPHVFGTAKTDPNATADSIQNSWETIKQLEKSESATSHDALTVPMHLPALMQAAKLGHKAIKSGFDWPNDNGPWQKFQEEISELESALHSNDPNAIMDEFGDVLFTLVNIGLRHHINAEAALLAANQKFVRRYNAMLELLREENKILKNLDCATKQEYWQRVKAQT